MYYNNLNITSNSFATGVTNALNQWNTALGTSMTAYSTDDEDITYWHTIKIFGGDWLFLTSLDIFNIDLSTNGLGGYTEPYAPSSASDTYIANGYTIEAYNFQYAHIAILDISLDSSYSTNYNFLCTHEMGHALGWYGHSPYSSDVMQGNGPNYNYPLTNRDKRHITQFYNYGGTLK